MLEVIRKIDEVARDCEADYFLAGATAREILLRHVFGAGPGPGTLDVDFAIAVRDWNHFRQFKSALCGWANFEAHSKKAQRLIHKPSGIAVDLIPFGGVQDADGIIAWPPEEDIVMRVTGFREALASSALVRLDQGLVIRVVSLPALMVLKLFAWADRKYERRDAGDIYTILRQYGDAGNEDRLYGSEVYLLESEGFDFEAAGARLLGRDAARLVSPETRRKAEDILSSPQQMRELTNQIISASRHHDAGQARRCELLLSKMTAAFLDA
ncbi:MAG TPA: nucleotidyl transferase AbiEii/AbiGii toxin family protein [Terriglobales bacterium]|nr:nucleotidyl transferase AbiEii/AbiGii toxin family protein [Terriglobales bacterium]